MYNEMKLTLKLHKAKLILGQMVKAPRCFLRQFEPNCLKMGWTAE